MVNKRKGALLTLRLFPLSALAPRQAQINRQGAVNNHGNNHLPICPVPGFCCLLAQTPNTVYLQKPFLFTSASQCSQFPCLFVHTHQICKPSDLNKYGARTLIWGSCLFLVISHLSLFIQCPPLLLDKRER